MATGGPPERELKLRCEDVIAARERLRKAGATRLRHRSFEENWLFDRDDELRSAGAVLRLRRDDQGVRLTHKGPPRWRGAVKIRAEHEVRVDGEVPLRGILRSLGYREVRRYEKWREEWELGDVTVSVDETPMGGFVEFEGEDTEEAARGCGFRPEDAETGDYLQLWEEYRRRHPEVPEHMLFPEEG